jgi:cytochrome P450
MPELLVDPLAFFFKSWMTLGPVFRVEAPTRNYVVMAGLEATRFLLREDARVFDHMPLYASVANELSATHYPIATHGERHAHIRRALKSAFSDDLLGEASEAILADVARFASRWRPGTSFVALDMLHDLLGNVVVPALTGRTLGPLLADAVRFARFSVGSGLGAYPLQFRHAPHYLWSRRRMFPFFRELLADHRKSPRRDFIDRVLAVPDEEGRPLSEENAIALAQMIYSNTLLYVAPATAFMLYSLLSSPEALARSQREIEGAGDLAALQACSYFGAVKTESMRLHPIGLAAPRVVKAPFEFDGCALEVGEAVLVAVSASHYDPDLYRDPYRFDPERHLPPRNESRVSGAYAPLGVGAHSCLGARLVDGMVLLTVAGILRAAKLELDPPDLTLRKRVNPFPEPTSDLVLRVAH